jgi:hypothetical protein
MRGMNSIKIIDTEKAKMVNNFRNAKGNCLKPAPRFVLIRSVG